jgi:hypothetical protein
MRLNGDKKKPGGEPGWKRLMMRETRRTLVSIFKVSGSASRRQARNIDVLIYAIRSLNRVSPR